MKIAVMQPYFFPYIGYWQLIAAVDLFILIDQTQYMRHSWINRNRILKPAQGWQYIGVPLKKHSSKSTIEDIIIDDTKNWRNCIYRQLHHYKKIEHYEEIMEIIMNILDTQKTNQISLLNKNIIKSLCHDLKIKTKIYLSSELNLDYSNVKAKDEWALETAKQLGASIYINPASGSDLFDESKYTASNVKLSFLKAKIEPYNQRRPNFEPSLSIIDVLIHNGLDGAKLFIGKYENSN